jgi:DNA-directed RNA polymerase specialized sigma24 family protein
MGLFKAHLDSPRISRVPHVVPLERLPTARELYDAHFDDVWRTLGRYDIPAADRGPLLQETFQRALAALPNWTPAQGEDAQTAAGAWVCGIARNVAREHCRKKLRERRHFDRDVDLTLLAAPSGLQGRVERERLLHSLLAQISRPQWREALIRSELDGQSTVEIMAEMRAGSLRAVQRWIAEGKRELDVIAARHLARQKREEMGVVLPMHSAEDILAALRDMAPPAGLREQVWADLAPSFDGGDGGDGAGPSTPAPAMPAPVSGVVEVKPLPWGAFLAGALTVIVVALALGVLLRSHAALQPLGRSSRAAAVEVRPEPSAIVTGALPSQPPPATVASQPPVPAPAPSLHPPPPRRSPVAPPRALAPPSEHEMLDAAQHALAQHDLATARSLLAWYDALYGRGGECWGWREMLRMQATP